MSLNVLKCTTLYFKNSLHQCFRAPKLGRVPLFRSCSVLLWIRWFRHCMLPCPGACLLQIPRSAYVPYRKL